MANMITIATALSMSSIVTNIRIGSGGAFSIISKSLGLEAGGAIGIPLYLAQAISVAFYIVGFSECWKIVFPYHNAALVSLVIWSIVLLISYYSTKTAFRLQYFIMAVVGFSLVSIFLGGDPFYTGSVIIYGVDPANFWKAFAIFFPAVTGILAGVSMSGELIDPKKSIPRGTLAAVGVTLIIYLILTVWLAFHVSAEHLVSNHSILIDLGRWKFLVVGGIMGATLSSALSMFIPGYSFLI
jgi:amino acid transporter